MIRLGHDEALAVVRPAPDDAPTFADDVTERVAGLYERFDHGVVVSSVRWGSDLVVLVRRTSAAAVSVPAPVPAWVPASGPVVHGVCVGRTGEADEAEVLAALVNPPSARELLGSFVLAGRVDGVTRLVVGSDLAHALVAVRHRGRVVWATRGLLALAAAGSPLRVRTDVVVERVLTDYVWGEDELLAGVVGVEEASVVDVAGGSVRSWWPRDERLAPSGTPTTAALLVDALREEAARLAAVDGTHLALTAGRDSRLLAGAVAAAGRVVPAVTMGVPEWPDVQGAEQVAQALGFEHRVMRMVPGEPDLDRALRLTRWTEGLDIAGNLLGPPLQWDGPARLVMLGGSGGETGRAFYWQGRPVPRGRRQLTARFLPAADGLPPAARTGFRARVDSELDRWWASAAGDAPRALDLLYALGRMRKWLLRSVLPGDARGVTTAYTSSRLTRLLLDCRAEDRQSARVFDEALQRLNLAQGPPVTALTRPAAVRRVLRDARARMAPRRVPLPPAPDALLERVTAAWGKRPRITPEVLGSRWWETIGDRAGRDPDARRQALNALAVDLLAAVVDELR